MIVELKLGSCVHNKKNTTLSDLSDVDAGEYELVFAYKGPANCFWNATFGSEFGTLLKTHPNDVPTPLVTAESDIATKTGQTTEKFNSSGTSSASSTNNLTSILLSTTVATQVDDPLSTTVATEVNNPLSTTVATEANNPLSTTVATHVNSPLSTTVATEVNDPLSTTVATQSNSPLSTSVAIEVNDPLTNLSTMSTTLKSGSASK